MNETIDEVREFSAATLEESRAARLRALVADLASDRATAKRRARLALEAMGTQAIPALAHALAEPNDSVRWEAVKALSELGDAAAAPALVRALEDSNSGIRWMAAEGLAALGRRALAPLLEALEVRSDSFWVREGARHVLHQWTKKGLSEELRPVLKALEDVEPALEVPLAAFTALSALRTSPASPR